MADKSPQFDLAEARIKFVPETDAIDRALDKIEERIEEIGSAFVDKIKEAKIEDAATPSRTRTEEPRSQPESPTPDFQRAADNALVNARLLTVLDNILDAVHDIAARLPEEEA